MVERNPFPTAMLIIPTLLAGSRDDGRNHIPTAPARAADRGRNPGHAWTIVAKDVTCVSAEERHAQVTARTAACAARSQRIVVASPCARVACASSRGASKPGGTARRRAPAKSIYWLSA